MTQQSKIEQKLHKKQQDQKYMNPQQYANRNKYYQQLLNTQQYKYVAKSLKFLQYYTSPKILDQLYLSFNGGKDATIVLYLFKMALQKKKKQTQNLYLIHQPLKCLYFTEPNPFQKVDEFKDIIIRCKFKEILENNLQMYELPTKNYSKQLTIFSQNNKLKFIIMGSRKDDPYCQNLGMQARSDIQKGYPDFIRLNPIIEWSHQQVWKFILNFNIPYCQMYKQGYTYLGNKDNTKRNSELYDKKANIYKPAYLGSTQIQKQSRVLNIKKNQQYI